MAQDPQVRAAAAQQLIENPILIDAFGAVGNEILMKMKASNPVDKESHQAMVIALQQLSDIELKIMHHINTGSIAASIEKKRGKSKWVMTY